MSTSININYTIEPQDLCDIICTAIESPDGEWVTGYTPSEYALACKEKGKNWYDNPDLYEMGGHDQHVFTIIYDDGDGNECAAKQIHHSDIIKGLEKLLSEKAQFIHVIRDDHDAGDADTLMQYIVFGDIIYG